MSSPTRKYLPLLLLATVLAAAVSVFVSNQPDPATGSGEPQTPVSPPHPAAPHPALSMLATAPDWSALEPYQGSITRADFERLLVEVFTTGEAWKTVITLNDAGATIHTTNTPDSPLFFLRFATPGTETKVPRNWRMAGELPPATDDRPLEGLHIAIDAGHIGGDWAKMEERWFVVGDGKPVMEGDMTLDVAKLMKPRLEALGAKVSLVREKLEPVTSARPEALHTLAVDSAMQDESPAALQRLAERLFYRTAEIRARAELVNHTIKPDLVLCLHFNAESWGDPNQPTLIDRTHLHLLLNGGYNDDEVLLADQRFALLQKLLQRTHEEEMQVGSTVAEIFARNSGLPPYQYSSASRNVRALPGQPYLWARNLLANRLYDCPVIFMEPYVMNSTIDYPRIQAGDYEGTRDVDGRPQVSIFREYADAVTEGLATHYRAVRAKQ